MAKRRSRRRTSSRKRKAPRSRKGILKRLERAMDKIGASKKAMGITFRAARSSRKARKTRGKSRRRKSSRGRSRRRR